jgi:Fic-DOC domain mobile mystery protein B
MGLILQYRHGQTPLDDDERDGLLVKGVDTKEQLDELEQHNIEEAIRWVMFRRKAFTEQEVLTSEFIRLLHRKMFGNVWAWAGDFRKTNKNLGVDKYEIPMALRNLLDDGQFWISQHTFPPDELALRFKHRIVSIHCFANGNGRHSRLIADIIAEKILSVPVFSWGARSAADDESHRKAYLTAIRAADKGDYQPLIEFARN